MITGVPQPNTGSKVKGTFELRNPTARPVRVVLEPLSFSVDSKGDPTYRKLDFGHPGAVLPPQAPHPAAPELHVGLRNRDRSAAGVVHDLTRTIAAANVETLKVVLKLPHTVYVLAENRSSAPRTSSSSQ